MAEEPLGIDGFHHRINSLALERPPNNRSVPDSEFCEPITRQDLPVRDIECVHDGDDVVVARALALDIFEELVRHKVMHVSAKVRRVQSDRALHVMEEEHDGPSFRIFLVQGV